MNPDTLARIAVLIVTLLNQFFVVIGHAPLDLDENTIYATVSGVWTVIWSLWCCWKNNSITRAAIIGDDVMHAVKEGRWDGSGGVK